MRKKKYGSLGELLEILTKGIQYRIKEWRRKRCEKEKHRWAEAQGNAKKTKCLDCPATAWRW